MILPALLLPNSPVPLWRRYFGKDRLHGGISLNHCGMHSLAGGIERTVNLLQLFLKSGIGGDRLVVGRLELLLFRIGQFGHRPLLIR